MLVNYGQGLFSRLRFTRKKSPSHFSFHAQKYVISREFLRVKITRSEILQQEITYLFARAQKNDGLLFILKTMFMLSPVRFSSNIYSPSKHNLEARKGISLKLLTDLFL